MTEVVDAEVKILKLIDLLKTTGGLRIEAEIADKPVIGNPSTPGFSVQLSGPDLPVLLHNNAELLQAIQQLAAAVLRLEDSDLNRLWFDAGYAKADRKRELERLANSGIEIVRTTSKPFRFTPMMACERRLLHLAFASSGLKSASTGLGGKRCVVLYPEGVDPPMERIAEHTGILPRKRPDTAA